MLFIKDKSKKTVFITGGAIRVGRLLVEFFVSKDWNVAFSYKSSENEARELEGKYEGDVKAYRVDFMNGVKGVLEKVLADFGRVDVLINNASVFAEKEFLQVSGSELDEYLNHHVKAPFFLIQ
jgi:NAD(P)-dependent dehydrogenase (short-subunit alcohol dehydrogenase family)